MTMEIIDEQPEAEYEADYALSQEELDNMHLSVVTMGNPAEWRVDADCIAQPSRYFDMRGQPGRCQYCGARAIWRRERRTGTGTIRYETCQSCPREHSSTARKGLSSQCKQQIGAFGMMLRRIARI